MAISAIPSAVILAFVLGIIVGAFVAVRLVAFGLLHCSDELLDRYLGKLMLVRAIRDRRAHQ